MKTTYELHPVIVVSLFSILTLEGCVVYGFFKMKGVIVYVGILTILIGVFIVYAALTDKNYMKALWTFTKILLTTAFSIGILLIQGYEDKKDEPGCKYLGYTKIEYGVGVTNCGDTVKIEEVADRLARYDSLNDIK